MAIEWNGKHWLVTHTGWSLIFWQFPVAAHFRNLTSYNCIGLKFWTIILGWRSTLLKFAQHRWNSLKPRSSFEIKKPFSVWPKWVYARSMLCSVCISYYVRCLYCIVLMNEMRKFQNGRWHVFQFKYDFNLKCERNEHTMNDVDHSGWLFRQIHISY